MPLFIDALNSVESLAVWVIEFGAIVTLFEAENETSGVSEAERDKLHV